MTKYKTIVIKIEGIRKRESMDILNTIAHNKIENIKDLIPFANGEYVVRLTSYIEDGEFILHNDSEIWIAKFLYRTKKLVYNGYNDQCDYNDRWMYITYDDLISFQREMNINETLGLETKLIKRPKLEKPFEVKVDDILKDSYSNRILVTKVTPRTFTYNYIDMETMEIDEWYGDGIARIKDHGNGPAWMMESDSVINKIE